MIVWSNYMRYRARARGFDLAKLEEIVRYSAERYADQATGRQVAIGKHDDMLVLVPFETRGEDVIPVTVHATSRQQISARLRSGRYTHA